MPGSNYRVMKRKSYRTTMPFSNGPSGGQSYMSPTTDRSVMPFNNVPTIMDILSGNKSISDIYPHAGGDWSPGHDTEKNYRDKGDDYKRREKDLEILMKMTPGENYGEEKWRVKVPGGSRVFPSFAMAQQYKRRKEEEGQKCYVARIAQSKSEDPTNRLTVIADSLNKSFLVDSISAKSGVRETGSAFGVAPGLFVTCAHVIEPYNKLALKNVSDFGKTAILSLSQNGISRRAYLADYDLEKDLALLTSDIESTPFELGAEISVGDEVMAVGSPHGYENNISEGIVGSVDRTIYRYEGAPDYFFIDASIFPGNSGGPVVSIYTGKVLGVVTLVISSEAGISGLNACLPVSYVRSFVKKNKGVEKK